MDTLKNVLQNYYLDYCNNYLTLRKFAEHNELTLEDAKKIIEIGRKINQEYLYGYDEPEELPF